MKQIKTEPIYSGYTPDIHGRYIKAWRGRKYLHVQINSIVQGHCLVVLKYAVEDAARVLADITANGAKYTELAETIHYINDGDYYAAIEGCEIIRPLAVIKEAAIR